MKKLLSLFVFTLALAAQDCVIRFDFQATGNTFPFNNQVTQCTNWTLGYFSTGYSALSIQLENSPPGINSATPGSFVVWAGNVVNGTHPMTSTTQGQVYLNGLYPWVQVHLTSATGTGEVIGAAYGYKVSSQQFPVAGGAACGALLTAACQPPAGYGWTRDAAAGVTFKQVNGTEVVEIPAPNEVGTSDNNLQASTIAIPATPYSVVLAFSSCTTNPSAVGPITYIVIGDGTKYVGFGLYMPSGTTGANPHPSIDNYTSRSVFSSTPMQGTADFVGTAICGGVLYLKIFDDGTNIQFFWNGNGFDFSPIRCAAGCGTNQHLIISRTAFLTPTRIGYATKSTNGNYPLYTNVYSFVVGTN